MKKFLLVPVVSVLLSACISAPQDNRSAVKQQEYLSEVSADMSGDYDVVDSRKDDLKLLSLTVNVHGDEVLFIGNQKNGQNFLATGRGCGGYRRGKWEAVFCRQIPEGFNYISFDLLDKPRTITDGALILPFPPLEAKSGDYLIDFGRRGGRSNYYLIKKHSN
jgi:hypothetical protein